LLTSPDPGLRTQDRLSPPFDLPSPVPPRYSLLAIDLDGTLLDKDGRVSARNLQALLQARAAGITTVICTGRGLVESAHIMSAIDQRDPVVVAGGAIIADPLTRRTIHRFAINQALVARAVDRLLAHKHPALVLKDPAEAGYDYLVVRGHERLTLDPVTQWWFDKLQVRTRTVDHLGDDEHPEHTVRVGACGLSDALARMKLDLAEACAGKACVHHFPAVIGQEHAARIPRGQSLHILELFDIGATKWSAISVIAKQMNIDPARIAAIGDEINDESMIKGAGLGIAMANAVPTVRDAANRHTTSNNEDGVAHAIEHILSSNW